MGTSQHPAYGIRRAVSDFASVILCDNPGMMELDGTNTWILQAPGSRECVVVDPGPRRHRDHLSAVADAGEIALVLITHRHGDHTDAVKRFRKMTKAPVRARTAEFCRGAAPLSDREIIEVAGLRITVLLTPGHTADSTSFLVEHMAHGDPSVIVAEPPRVLGRAMVTGDTILGAGTTVLDPTDGTLEDYLHSLNRLIVEGDGCALLPGHGPDHPELIPIARYYKKHREDRLDEIRRALTEMGRTPDAAKPMRVVRKVYRDVDKKLWPAARMSVKVQLTYLRSN